MNGLQQTLLCVVSLCTIYLAKGDVIVETKLGKVSGKEVQSILKDEKFYSFLSIPYAEPPIGKLRFMPPKPHSGWSDILDVKKEKKPCAHYNLPIKNIKNYGFSGSEDCLHLSVHTPKLPIHKENPNLPVIVFLYNENFKVAYNASKEYGPDFFMKEDVIIVTLQHRLGSLGFLSFEDDLLPGNNGLRDVLMALKWVQANIASFGGDPNRITLMGHDGGAVIVDILLHSPKAKGLFHRAALLSGTSWSSTFLKGKPRERAIEFTKQLEEHATTSSYLLKRLTPFDVMVLTELEERSVHADEAREIQQGILPFTPVIEHDHPDAIITQLPESRPVDFDVPVMIGYTSRSGIHYTERFIQRPQFLTMADRDFMFLFPYRTNYTFDIHSKVYADAIQSIKDFYFKEGYIKVSKPGEYISYSGDMHNFITIDYTVRQYAKNPKNTVYYFMFDHSGEFNLKKKNLMNHATNIDGTWGATIGDELCYSFLCKPLKKAYKKALEDPDSEDIIVIKNMVKLWSDFAKTGNPTPPGAEVEWKPATAENKECLVIAEELTLKTNLHDDVVKFWDNFLETHKKLAVDGVVKDIKAEL